MASPDEIWLVDFGDPHPGEPAHHRPALVLGPPDTFGPGFPFTILAPLTTARRGLSLHVEVESGAESGLSHSSYVQCELIRSVNSKRLVRRLGVVDIEASHRVRAVVLSLLGY